MLWKSWNVVKNKKGKYINEANEFLTYDLIELFDSKKVISSYFFFLLLKIMEVNREWERKEEDFSHVIYM